MPQEIQICQNRSSYASLCSFFALLAWAGQSADARRIACKDINGNWKVMDEKAWPQTPANAKGKMHAFSGTGINFTVDYDDQTNSNGIGFDDPTYGAERRQVVDRILTYLNTVFNETGACQIQFEASQTDGSGPLAQGGPVFFMTSPYTTPFPITHIRTGADPTDAAPDMYVTVDFGWPWYSGTGDCPGDKMDLFSVLLHEMTHGLGFISFAEPNGTGVNGENVHSTFDNKLYTGFPGYYKMWDAQGQIVGVSWLTTDGAYFNGTAASNASQHEFQISPRVYIADPFQPGSSLGHWSDTFPSSLVMLPAIAPGTMARQYDGMDKGALQDLGYAMVTPTPTPTPGVIFVKQDAPANGDGKSWATAFQKIHDAIPAVQNNNTIWVAKGTYLESDIRFTSATGMSLIGGLAGTETPSGLDIPARNLAANETIIDAQGNGRVIYISEVTMTKNYAIDGFTITGGDNAQPHASQWLPGSGGGIVSFYSNLNVKNCKVIGNNAQENGGGIYAYGGAISIADCLIEGNTTGPTSASGSAGGGAYLLGSGVLLSRVTFRDNTASHCAGGLWLSGDSSLSSCKFIGNIVQQTNKNLYLYGGGAAGFGGGVYTLENCLVAGNKAPDGDAFMMMPASSSMKFIPNKAYFKSCTIAGNGDASSSVTIFTRGKKYDGINFKNTVLASNSATTYGVNTRDTSTSLQNCLLYQTGTQGSYTANALATNSVLTNPQFRSVTDFHLGAGSPAVDAGLSASLSNIDLDGRSRTIPYDIGCYEYTAEKFATAKDAWLLY